MRFLLTITASFLLLSASFAQAADKPLVENDFYKLIAFDIPKEIMLEAGGIELLANGRAAVSTRRGEVWMLDKPFAEPGAEGKVADAKWSRFAHGLHEVLGIVERDGWIYVTQRGEVSRLKDTDADGSRPSTTTGTSTATITSTPSDRGSTRRATSGSCSV